MLYRQLRVTDLLVVVMSLSAPRAVTATMPRDNDTQAPILADHFNCH
ncbi:hypothetical protein HAP47_0000450 [Bradyrhizobium sp. 41S5]|nr:hypothetical protein [Bradyrhizobium sp. 41S5]UFX45245.1 hypothetical protein HAP47_0000450 [Bradyrhizobium sp. 41S5]